MARIYPREIVKAYIEKYITTDYKEFENDSGDWININSVFSRDSRYHMGFNTAAGYVNDYKGQSWSLTKFISEYQNITEEEADRILFKLLLKIKKNGFSMTTQKKREPAQAIDLPAVKDHPPWQEFTKDVLRDKVGRKAFLYLMRRGIEARHINKFQLKYVKDDSCWICGGQGILGDRDCSNCNATGKNFYFQKIIIPTYENGNMVYFQARDFTGGSFRYMNPKLGKTQVVYFYDLLKEGDRIFITEGPFDAMTLFDYSATCIMGSVISEPQVMKILKKKPKEIIFVPDFDPDEETKIKIISTMMKNIKKVRALSDNKIEVGVFKWNKLSQKKDINEAGLTTVNDAYISYVSRFKDEIEMKLSNEM